MMLHTTYAFLRFIDRSSVTIAARDNRVAIVIRDDRRESAVLPRSSLPWGVYGGFMVTKATQWRSLKNERLHGGIRGKFQGSHNLD